MRRSPEQVHEEDGHDEPVQSCELCEHEPTAGETESDESEPVFRTTEAPAPEVRTTAECLVCGRPVVHRGLCGSHWQSRRGEAVRR